MKTKWSILMIFVFLVSLSITAWYLTPNDQNSDKAPLTWVTDPNPQRTPQVEWFNKLNPDCNLSIDPDNTGVMKVVVQCSANMGPDLIDGVVESSIQTYVDSGILLDVTEQAKELGFGLDTLPETVRQLVTAKVLTKDGKYVSRQFCYPCNVFQTFLFYNKNIFDKYKIPYPKEDMTWEEYMKLGKQLTKYSEDDKNIPDIFGAAGSSVDVIAWGKGGQYFNKWGTVSEVDSDAFVDAFEMFHKLIFEYDIEPSPNQKAGVSSQGGWGGGYLNWFAEGKIGMYWGARWMLIQLRRFKKEQQEQIDDWIKANPDKDPSECPIKITRIGCTLVPRFKNARRYTTFGARSTGVNAKSKNLDKAVKFLAYLAGPKYSEILNEGADSKPGNKKYISIEQFIHKDYPEEEEVHKMSIKAVPYGRVPRRSPFVTSATVKRILSQVSDKVVANKFLTRKQIKEALKVAAERINIKIARNIDRNQKSQKIYQALLKEGAEPIKYTNLLTIKQNNEESKK